MPFPLGTPPGYYATNPSPLSARNNIFYVGDTVTLKLSQATPTGYTVYDYYGNVVTSGAVSSTTVSLGSSWSPGWYRVLYTGASSDATYGPSYGASCFAVIRSHPHMLPMPAPTPTVRSNGAPGQHGSAPELPTRGVLGMGTDRLTITDATAVSGNDSVAVASLDAPWCADWWTDPGDSYRDDNRPRLNWVAFSGRSYDRYQILNATGGVYAIAFCLNGAINANGDKVFVSAGPGTTGDKLQVFYPNNSTLVETFDNLATSNDVEAAINGVSNYIWVTRGTAGARTATAAATAIGNSLFNGVKNCAQTLYPLGITGFEGPINEPVLDTSIGIKMRLFSEAVKAGNPDAKVMGPCTVDIVNGWHYFYESGAHNWVDYISFHDYNTNVNGDMNEGRLQIESFLALKNTYAPNLPMWQTEATHNFTSVGGGGSSSGVFHPRRARVSMMKTLVWEQYGIPRERNVWWYDYSGGFWSYASFFLLGDSTPCPPAVTLRVLAEETFGQAHHHRLDFGNEAANHIFLGSVYKQKADTLSPSTVVLIAASHIPGATVTLRIVGTTSALTVIDGLGNSSTVSIASGLAVIPVDDIPTYVRLPAGVTATVESVLDWGTSMNPSISSYGTATLGGLATSTIIDDTFMSVYAAYPGGTGIAYSSITVPDAAVVTLPSAATVDGVCVWCGPCWQSMSGLVDFDVDTTVDGTNWVTQKTVTKTTPTSAKHGASSANSGTNYETYWDEQWIFPAMFASPVANVIGVRINVRATSYGGEPDSQASNSSGGRADQRVALEEIAIFSASTPTLAASYTSAVLADSPSGYWRLGETSSVMASQTNSPTLDATVAGTVTRGVAGTISDGDKAVTLTATVGQSISVTDPGSGSVLDLGDVFTLECWWNPAQVNSNQTLMAKGQSSAGYGLQQRLDGTFALAKAGVAVCCSSTVTLGIGTWVHLVATKNGGTVKLYLNGSDVTGTVTPTTFTDNNFPFYIGSNGTATVANGTLDEVAIYPTALSQARIQVHYASAVTPSPPANTVAPLITGSTAVGVELFCSTGTWSGHPATKYTYQWKRNGSNIGGATTPIYLKAQADVGSALTCSVTASNPAGSASVTSSNSVTPALKTMTAGGVRI